MTGEAKARNQARTQAQSAAQSSSASGRAVLIAALLLSFVFGTVHAFSVFLEPMEAAFQIGRSRASLTYSLALVALTFGVLIGHRVYAMLAPERLALLLCLAAAAGLLLAAVAPSLTLVWLGYSLIFGLANGLGYGFALQYAAQANPARGGLAMGLVTAVYGLGAALAPLPLWAALSQGGLAAGFAGLAAVMLAVSLPIYRLLKQAAQPFLAATPHGDSQTPKGLVLLWIGYGAGVAAGLAAIGHATGIARAGGLGDTWVQLAPVAIAAANTLGGLLGGALTDRLAPKQLLMALPFLSAAALAWLALGAEGAVLLAGLALVGFAYGAVIAVYPAAIARRYGAVAGVKVYGRVFTAWGTAGLLAPWAAGLLYEGSGSYRMALLGACALALVSLGSVAGLAAPGQERRKK